MPLANTLWPSALHQGDDNVPLVIANCHVVPLDCGAPGLANKAEEFA